MRLEAGSWWDGVVERLDGAGSGRIASMEGLRGLAVSLVFLVHYHAIFGDFWQLDALASAFATIGTAGVDIFFLISGFLIYGAAIRRPIEYVPFIRRRLQRLYPTFLAMFAIYLVLAVVLPEANKLPTDPFGMLLYLCQNLLLLPGFFPIRPMITVAWSLSFELFFYLSVPLLVLTLRFRSWPPSLRVGLMAALGLTLLFLTHRWDLPLHARLLLFLAGMALYEWKARVGARAPHPSLHAIALGLAILLLPITYLIEMNEALGSWAQYLRALWIALALLPIGMSAFSDKGPLAASLSWRPLRWMGNISYSYYLMHGLVLKTLGLAAAMVVPGLGASVYWFAGPLVFAITVVVSHQLYEWVEYPASLAPSVRAGGSPT